MAKNATIETSYGKFELPVGELRKLEREVYGEIQAKVRNDNKLNVKTSYGELIVPAAEVDKLKKEITSEINKIKGEVNKNKYKELDKEDKLNNVKLYKWSKKGKKIEKGDVMEMVGSLKNPGYQSKFTRYIKNGDIKGLQKSINKMIDEYGKTNGEMEKIKIYLEGQGVPLNKDNHIREDGKLGPQTMNALFHLDQNMGYKDTVKDYIEEYAQVGSNEEKEVLKKRFKKRTKKEIYNRTYNNINAKKEEKSSKTAELNRKIKEGIQKLDDDLDREEYEQYYQ